MSNIENMLGEEEILDNFICPSCGIMPKIQGITFGCNDLEGCASVENNELEVQSNDDENVEELNFED